MSRSLSRPALVAAIASAAALGAALAAGPVVTTATAAAPVRIGVRQQVGDPGDESKEIRSSLAQFYGARSAPGAPGNIPAGAYTAAYEHVQSMPVASATWTNVTSKPYDADDPNYRDPAASNSGGGAGFVTGRITGIAVDGGYVYAGGAEGGVFRSGDQGLTWTPISDRLPALATGDLQMGPDGSLWLATGEADFGDGLGAGVFRLASPRTGSFSVADRIGGKELESHAIAKLAFKGDTVYAATSRGLYRHSATDPSGAWERVLWAVDKDDPGLTAYSNITNDVAINPRTGLVVANLAWRAGAPQNGIYVSPTGAPGSFTKVAPTGAINPKDLGIADLAYSSDGGKLYVVLESPSLFNDPHASTSLAGVYVSPNGDPAGPYSQIASPSKLASSGSAQKVSTIGKGYSPGVQAWYNRFVAVDPENPNHVYVGLEEVYETRDGGASWSTIGRYWDFGLKCASTDSCDGNVLHSDQHAVALGNGRVYAGNDGGLYSRALDGSQQGWTSLAATGQLGTLQYYSVGVGKLGRSGVAVWGGLQDNGVSLLKSGAKTMVSPFGGDGGDQIVDPNDGCKTVGEYVYLTLQMTTNCGVSDGTTNSVVNIDPLDPNPQFIAPIAADPVDGTWYAGGQLIYKNTKTWNSKSGADWDILGDQGSGRSATAVAGSGGVVWSGWCGSCSSGSFASGIATTAGTGVLHEVAVSTPTQDGPLPRRYVAGLTIDPADPTGRTAYAVFNGFSAHWVEGPGAGIGHVFVTKDGGATWRDISGAPDAQTGLPDVPASHLAVTPDHSLVLTTDVGVFISSGNGSWSRLGSNLPYTIATDVRVGPDGKLYVATFGRGIWSTPVPKATKR